MQLTIPSQGSGLTWPDAASNNSWAVEAGADIGLWKLGSVPADRIKSRGSQWCELESEGVVDIIGESHDGGSYDVAFNTSCRADLSSLGLKLYDPTSPDEQDVEIHGRRGAIQKARARFLDNAVLAIRSKCSSAHEQAYRDTALSYDLREALEEAVLQHDLQVMACRRSGCAPR